MEFLSPLDVSMPAGSAPAAGIARMGRSAQGALEYYDNGKLGSVPRVVACDVGTQTFTNSVTTDQDFTTLLTIPANTLVARKCFRVTVCVQIATGTSSATLRPYLKLGSTKVLQSKTLSDWINNVTESCTWEMFIWGRVAPGGAANTTSGFTTRFISTGDPNVITQPVAVATNGALDLKFGVIYSATGGTDSIELQSWLVEELN